MQHLSACEALVERAPLPGPRQALSMLCCQKGIHLPLHAADLIPEGLLCQLLVHLPHFHDVEAQDVAQLAQPCKLTLISLNHHCRQGTASRTWAGLTARNISARLRHIAARQHTCQGRYSCQSYVRGIIAHSMTAQSLM